MSNTKNYYVSFNNLKGYIRMFIGEFANRCGVSIKTVRHYEKLGLLPEIKRRGNYRVFSDLAFQRMQLIQLCKNHGLTLAEIIELISHQPDSPQALCQRSLTYIQKKQQQFEFEIKALQEKQHSLNKLEHEVRLSLLPTSIDSDL